MWQHFSSPALSRILLNRKKAQRRFKFCCRNTLPHFTCLSEEYFVSYGKPSLEEVLPLSWISTGMLGLNLRYWASNSQKEEKMRKVRSLKIIPTERFWREMKWSVSVFNFLEKNVHLKSILWMLFESKWIQWILSDVPSYNWANPHTYSLCFRYANLEILTQRALHVNITWWIWT